MWTTTRRLLGVFIMLFAITVACGSTTATAPDNGAADTEHAGTEYSEASLDVNADKPIPEVDISLDETDVPGVFELQVTLTNFTITPDAVDGDPVDNEGHMHLLIDGEKVERFTDLEREVHVPEGVHLVEVELNANNHLAYAIDGTPIRSGLTVTGSGEAEPVDEHGHDATATGSAIEEGLTMADANVSLMAEFANGEISVDGDDRINVSVGDIVAISVTSDVSDEAHLHGYDLFTEVHPGDSSMMLFTADTPGKFELEFETSGTFVLELVVS